MPGFRNSDETETADKANPSTAAAHLQHRICILARLSFRNQLVIIVPVYFDKHIPRLSSLLLSGDVFSIQMKHVALLLHIMGHLRRRTIEYKALGGKAAYD